MQRSTFSLSSILISAGLCAGLAFGCAAGGSTNGAGGKTGSGGGSNPGSGGGSNPGSGGGSNPGSGGGSNPGSGGGSNPGSGGGSNPGSGGVGNPGSGGLGGSTRPVACAPASVDVISDFEENQGTMIRQGTPVRTGWWYTYFPNPTAANPPVLPPGASQAPPSSSGPIAVAPDPMATNAACNKALHVTGSGLGTAPNNFSGFGAGFLPMPAPSQVKTPYDLSAYSGISFKIRSGAGVPPAVYFEVLTKETQPATSGGTATVDTIDLFNTRGKLLNPPWIPNAIGPAYQTITVPFGQLVPRWMPAGFGGGGKLCVGTTPKCQAPKFNPASVIGIQFSMYADPGFPLSGTLGTYDLWVDDVTLVRADAGLLARTGFPTAGAGSVGANCTKPAGADAKFLVPAYNFWKSTFAPPPSTTVIRPENGNDTVSEGIAYAMLIAVNMNDQPFFDAMYTYWKGHKGAGTSTAGLMTWCIPNVGGSCNPNGGGSATDADEDAAFALIQAGKLWGGTYGADARGLITDIWNLDIDKTSLLPTGGSNYGNSTSARLTNASYFAPSLYRAFTAAGDTNNWAGVIAAVYGVIRGGLSGTNGLFPAWCSGNCSAAASNGAATDTSYQYDSHRIPWRIGLDYCFNGGADAKAYLAKTSGFFQGQSATGIAKVADIYSTAGQPGAGVAPNSSSILGTAAVGAMSDPAFKTFLDDAYQSVLDQLTRGTMAPRDAAGLTPYSYFNASVGMMTLLTMTGNFRNM